MRADQVREMPYTCLECRRRPVVEPAWRPWLPLAGLVLVMTVGLAVSLQQIAHAGAYRPVVPETVTICSPAASPAP